MLFTLLKAAKKLAAFNVSYYDFFGFLLLTPNCLFKITANRLSAGAKITLTVNSHRKLIPATIINLVGSQAAKDFSTNYLTNTTPVGFVIYVALILFFGYFYTFLQMNPEEMSKNLSKSGAYIPGVRPGNDTIDYTLRLWINSAVTDNAAIAGKTLSYRIDVEATQEIAKTPTFVDTLENKVDTTSTINFIFISSIL